MKEILKKLAANKELSFGEIQFVIRSIKNKEVTDAQIGAFMVAVTQKGVSADEFYAFAASMREFSNRVILDEFIVDSCGTGADLSHTINISTAGAIVANSCGVSVLKQTNSSITSSCGSSDFLEAMGLEIARIPQDAKMQFSKNKIAFVHSPFFNEFARINNPIRQQLGLKTIFNYLGPMINPSFPDAQLLGVSSNEMCEKMVYALEKLGTKRALVLNGINPNLDELSLCSETDVYELNHGKISKYRVKPEDFGLMTVDLSEIQGGSRQENAQIITDIFKGKIKGAKRDVLALNAGAMIYLAGFASSIYDGLQTALESIENGVVYDNLLKLQGAGVKCL